MVAPSHNQNGREGVVGQDNSKEFSGSELLVIFSNQYFLCRFVFDEKQSCTVRIHSWYVFADAKTLRVFVGMLKKWGFFWVCKFFLGMQILKLGFYEF